MSEAPNRFAKEIIEEYWRATRKHGGMASAHEGYAVILEELDELKAEVWKRSHDKAAMRQECVQIAAMAMKFALCICPEEP